MRIYLFGYGVALFDKTALLLLHEVLYFTKKYKLKYCGYFEIVYDGEG